MLAHRVLHSHRLTSNVFLRHVHSHKNAAIVELLRQEKLNEERSKQPNTFKINAFTKAIQVIVNLPHPIQSGDDRILETKGIGIGIKNRIQDYFLQHDLAHAQTSDERENALKRRAVIELQRVPGIGTVKAKALAEAGCLSLLDLLNKSEFIGYLSPLQRTSLKYMDHLAIPTTPNQVEQAFNLCQAHLSSKYEFIAVGDYRRGVTSCPSMELMVLHPDHVHIPVPTAPPPLWEDEINPDTDVPTSASSTKLKRKALPKALTKKDREGILLHSDVVPILQQRGVLLEKLSETRTSWTGIVRLPPPSSSSASVSPPISRLRAPELQLQPGIYRKITLHIVPRKSRAAGLLNLTGDDGFLRELKEQAAERGRHLDEFGVWKWVKHQPVPVAEEEEERIPVLPPRSGYWSLVRTETEQEIFEELGLPFVEPQDRNSKRN